MVIFKAETLYLGITSNFTAYLLHPAYIERITTQIPQLTEARGGQVGEKIDERLKISPIHSALV